MQRVIALGSIVVGLVLAGAACPTSDPVSPGGHVAVGTWGGENVAFIVESNTTHIHVGCTNGDFTAPITVDDQGRFNVSGSYVLRAYPVAVGPSLPAQLAGRVAGRQIVFTVAVNDTVEKKLVVLGPETVTFERDPRMGPCPICVRPKR
jgi:hypothetical protein